MNTALAAAIESLEAERLRPVPKASHVAAVDVDDLALLLAYVEENSIRGRMTTETAVALDRLDKAIRRAA